MNGSVYYITHIYHNTLLEHLCHSTLLCTVCFQVLLDAVTMVHTGLLKTNENHCVLYSIKCLKRGENTHHLCSRSFNVSEWNGDHLIVSRRQSILCLQMLSPRTLVVKDCNRWNSLKLVQSHKDSPARALTGSNNPHSPQSAKAERHFFACKWHNTIILQAGKTGLRRETQYRLGTYTETNKQVWLVLHWGLKGKHPSGGERMVQYSCFFFFFTHGSHYSYSGERCFVVTKLSEFELSRRGVGHPKLTSVSMYCRFW